MWKIVQCILIRELIQKWNGFFVYFCTNSQYTEQIKSTQRQSLLKYNGMKGGTITVGLETIIITEIHEKAITIQ